MAGVHGAYGRRQRQAQLHAQKARQADQQLCPVH